MNNKIIIIIIIGILISNGLSVLAFQVNDTMRTINEKITISEPVFNENENHIFIHVKEATSFLIEPRRPLLPMITKIFTFPFGTEIIDVNVEYETETYELSKEIIPCPQPIIIFDNPAQIKSKDLIIDNKIYYSDNLYPYQSYFTSSGAGLKNNEHVLFYSINIIPQYNPSKNIILIPSEIEIKINYMLPKERFFKQNNEYDMIIIAPENFTESIQPLIDHKNQIGVKTYLKTIESIYSEFDGRDKQEQIKYFIKDAIEQYSIKYVFIIGSIDLIPIRYVSINSSFVESLPTDIYYADVYNSNMSFSSWDTNNNNLFGEYVFSDRRCIDFVDLYHDVGIGRILCENIDDVEIIVNKIINYEKNVFGEEWLNNIIVIGGDTVPYQGVYEGEWTTNEIIEFMDDYNFISKRFWTSEKRFLHSDFFVFLVNLAFFKGAGFVSFAGHGNVDILFAHYPNSRRGVSYELKNQLFLFNYYKLPIIFLDACLAACPDYKNYNYHTSFAWNMVKKKIGGSIASIGQTRSGYIVTNSQGVIAGTSILNIEFFKSYEENIMLSDMLINAKNEYINNIGKHCIIIEEFILYGDPSLKIGGY